jgi:hypothetical protein
LQRVKPPLDAENVAIYAVSYDEPAVLAGFAERYGITYPLLADVGSNVIRRLGLLNEDAPERVAGIPHPGVVVLDNAGIVVERHFYDSYRERDTAAGLLEQTLGLSQAVHGPRTRLATEAVTFRTWFDAPAYAWGQRLRLTVELVIAPGYHVYGELVPDGYVPLSVTIAPLERVSVGATSYPPPHALHIEALHETFSVHTGTVRVTLPVTFMVVDAGEQCVSIQVTYQVCSDHDCRPPETATLELRLPEIPLIERPQR